MSGFVDFESSVEHGIAANFGLYSGLSLSRSSVLGSYTNVVLWIGVVGLAIGIVAKNLKTLKCHFCSEMLKITIT